MICFPEVRKVSMIVRKCEGKNHTVNTAPTLKMACLLLLAVGTKVVIDILMMP